MEQLIALALNFIDLSAEASPWLLLGLLIAGLMKVWIPSQLLSKHLGQGKSAITKAAFIGAPLPLCSCGVIPVATELRRSGASASATASFLVATPETGVDSVSVSYALLGPIFAVYRPFAAIISAIVTGLLVATVPEKDIKPSHIDKSSKKTGCCGSKKQAEVINVPKKTSCCSSKEEALVVETSKTSCCSSKKEPHVDESSQKICCSSKKEPHVDESSQTSCCSSKKEPHVDESSQTSCCSSKKEPHVDELSQTKTNCCSSKNNTKNKDNTFIDKTKKGIYYASTQLIDDIIIWLFIGLVFASLIRTFLPETFLISYGSGLPAMLLMIIISIPMYICATASTPIAAGFIMAGLSPGTALVFMMAGPATNISTLGVIRNEMGGAVLIRYLLGVAISAIAFGLLLDFSLGFFDIDISEQMKHSHELLPTWFGLSCAGLIAFLSLKPLRRLLIK